MYNFMTEILARTKKWGNSIGIILPKKLGVLPNQEIRVRLQPTRRFTVVREMFGRFKFRRPVRRIMKEIDTELEG